MLVYYKRLVMLEITPIPPYPEEVRYPHLTSTNVVELQAERPSIFSVHTAGLLLDDDPLDTPIPFQSDEPPEDQNVRSLGFTITQVGDTFHMPNAVAFYDVLVSQMLGALLHEGPPSEELVKNYSFYLEEILLSTTFSEGNVHYDATTSNATDRAALVSNVYPTWYAMQRLNRFEKMAHYTMGLEWPKIPPELIWCPRPKEITVQEGGTPHGTPDFPTGASLTRRLASLRVSTGSLVPFEVSRIEIDGNFYKEEDLPPLAA